MAWSAVVRRSLIPLVLVVVQGCSSPSPPAAQPRPMIANAARHDAAPADAPADAPVDAPVDAAIADAQVIAAGDAAPPMLLANVINIHVDASDVVVTIDRGQRRGVYVGQRARLIDDNGKPVPGSDFTIETVTGRTAKGRIALPSATVTEHPKVLIFP